MESQNDKGNPKKGSVKVLPFLPRVTDIENEPEMIELKSMIRSGELDKNRTIDYLGEDDGTDKSI